MILLDNKFKIQLNHYFNSKVVHIIIEYSIKTFKKYMKTNEKNIINFKNIYFSVEKNKQVTEKRVKNVLKCFVEGVIHVVIWNTLAQIFGVVIITR